MQQHLKRITHRDQVEFISAMRSRFNILNTIHVIYHIKYLKNKENHTIISIDAQKTVENSKIYC